MVNQREYRSRDSYDPPRRAPSERRPPRRIEEREDRSYDDRRRVREPMPHRPARPESHSESWYSEEPHYRKPPSREPPRQKRPSPERTSSGSSYRDEGRRPARPRGSSADYYPPERNQPRTQRPMNDRYGQGSQPPRSSGGTGSDLRYARNSTNRKIFLFVYNLIFYTVMIGIILSAVMFYFSEKSDSTLMGYRFYQVLTNSMAPQGNSTKGGFYAGDIIIVKMMDGSEVKKNDVVTFQVGENGQYLTHRMIDRLDELNGEKGDYIVTKGDANNTADPPILAERVFGKVVFAIPKMGSIITFVRENIWLSLVVVLSTFGFFLVLKAYFLQPNDEKQVSY